MNTRGLKAAVLILSFTAAGCATATPGQRGALLGSALGAGLGAIIGHQSGSTAEGALIGAAAGGIGGALLGESAASKFCQSCGRSYFTDQEYCQFDGALLTLKGGAAPAPVQQAVYAPQPVYTPAAPETFVVNVPNSNGSFTSVTLQAEPNGTYIGPRGEIYTARPTVEQLRMMYGK